jgi:hypothetical protein
MRPTDEKVQPYNAAKELLAQGKDELYRYGALELRRCIEALVYEKLEAYRKWISEKLARTWQPPQAFKALLEIDPGGQDDGAFAVAAQEQLDGPPNMPFRRRALHDGGQQRPGVSWDCLCVVGVPAGPPRPSAIPIGPI